MTNSKAQREGSNLEFLSQLEPKNIDIALLDEFWLLAMHEELIFIEIMFGFLSLDLMIIRLLVQNGFSEINLMSLA